MPSAYGTGLVAGALSNAFGDTFKGLAEGGERETDIEAKALQSKQAREQFPLQQQLLKGQIGHLGTQAEQIKAQTGHTQAQTQALQQITPEQIKLMQTQGAHLLRPEPIQPGTALYSWRTGKIEPGTMPKIEALPGGGGMSRITDFMGNVTYTRQLTPERAAEAQAAMAKVDTKDPYSLVSTLAQYKDVFPDALPQYLQWLRTKYSADTRAQAMRDVARLRGAGAGSQPQETTTVNPGGPVRFGDYLSLNQKFNSLVERLPLSYPGINGVGSFADPNSPDVFDHEVGALVPKSFLIKKWMMREGVAMEPYWNGRQWTFSSAINMPTVKEVIKGPVQQPQQGSINFNFGNED